MSWIAASPSEAMRAAGQRHGVRVICMRHNVRHKPSLRTPLLTLFAMLAFASNSLLCRVALTDTAIDAASFTAIRLASGALILVAPAAARRRGRRRAEAGRWRRCCSAYAVFFSFAYRDLTAATGALLLFGGVQLTMMGYGLWTGERLRGVKLAGPGGGAGGP